MNNPALICNAFGENAEIVKLRHESIAEILLKSKILILICLF